MQSHGEREIWAALMRVTFERDVFQCHRCGGRLRHIATLLDAARARAVLAHLGLPVRGPPSISRTASALNASVWRLLFELFFGILPHGSPPCRVPTNSGPLHRSLASISTRCPH